MSGSVVYLEDSDDLRIVFKQLIQMSLGIDCLTFPSVADFIAHSQEVLKSRIVFLDINLGSGAPSGIDAYKWLLQQHYMGKIFFLTGHGQNHPLVLEAAKSGVKVLVKPIPAVQLCSIIESVVCPQEGVI